MRRKVYLYIAGKLADLDDSSFLLMNYTQDDLSNPTVIKNSFSQQVTLKGTPANNDIFGHLFRLDRVTDLSGSESGIGFDVLRKTSFQIFDDLGHVLESGYIKLDSVSRAGAQVEYTITMYGGLGSFFYNLTYREDGEKKALSDLIFKGIDGTDVTAFGIDPGESFMSDAWYYLRTGSFADANYWNIINFAPCYNGFPEDFDADKAVYSFTPDFFFDNVLNGVNVDGTFYTKKDGTNSILLSLGAEYTEWEVRDLRWYLQRPVVSVKAILAALSDPRNNGGYELVLDPVFFKDGNRLYESWVTLPLISKEDRTTRDGLNNLLKATGTPADYLISFAKMFGLVFLYDNVEKKVTIAARNTFFNGTIVDISGKIDRATGFKINPIMAESHWFLFGKEQEGEFAEDYKADFGRDYASQRVDTGNVFNSDTENLSEDLIYSDGAEVLERSRMFTSDRIGIVAAQKRQYITIPYYSAMTGQYWDNTAEDKSTEVTIGTGNVGEIFPDNPAYPYSDWLPKLQCHQADNKAVDLDGVLLLFDGLKDVPEYTIDNVVFTKKYRFSGDSPDMATLNGGTPCYNFSADNIVVLDKLPSFRRLGVDSAGLIRESFEWGVPLARGVPDVSSDPANPRTIYSRFWKKYFEDRYNRDTRAVTCKVNLTGMTVGQEMLRNFYYFDNSLWVLNKITNYSLTTDDLTECEFIKVQDTENYTNGQDYGD